MITITIMGEKNNGGLQENMDMTYSKIIEYRLYSKDVPYSSRFVKDDILKELLVDRFTKCIPDEYKHLDSGIIYGKRDTEFIDVCKKYSKDSKRILVIYEEKKRDNYLILTYDGKIITNNRESTINEYSTVINESIEDFSKKIDINVSETLQALLKNYLYLMQIDLSNNSLKHPIENTTISKCEQYVKMSVLLAMRYGCGAMQIERILQYMKCFGLSTNHLKNLLVDLLHQDMNQYDLYMKMLLGKSKNDHILLTDLLYMVCLGEYHRATEIEVLDDICNVFEINYNTADLIYKMIKEIR